MTWQLIRLADAAATPWRNGGGLTRELAAAPAGGDWTWRISVAEVASAGPFSRFPGVQRWFAVLEGAGVRLRLPGAEHRLTAASAPLTFDGEAPVECSLVEGATRDLNLMVRRDRATARMERLAGARSFRADTQKVVAVYAAEGGARLQDAGATLLVPEHSLAWRELAAGSVLQVTAQHALWMEIEPWE